MRTVSLDPTWGSSANGLLYLSDVNIISICWASFPRPLDMSRQCYAWSQIGFQHICLPLWSRQTSCTAVALTSIKRAELGVAFDGSTPQDYFCSKFTSYVLQSCKLTQFSLVPQTLSYSQTFQHNLQSILFDFY